MNDLLLKNAKIVNHEGIFEGVVYVKNDKIEEVYESGDLPDDFKDDSNFGSVVDLEGKYLLPGVIDVHVHFRTPGQEYKEDWETGSKAALAGGVTTVLDMPNNDPAVTDNESLQNKKEIVQESTLVNYGLYVGANPQNINQIKDLEGVAGIKVYMGSSTGDLLLSDKELLEELMSKTECLIAIHAESEECIREKMDEFKDKEEPEVHSKIRAPECAYEAVKTAVHLAKKYKRHLHICHLSTEKELDTVRKFADDVSVEVTPHHLFLTDMDYERYGNKIKINPPVRSVADQVALWQGIKDGTVNIIATDHAPHRKDEKAKTYSEVPSGVPGVQTMLPLLLNAVNEGKLALEKVVELTCYNPSKIFKIANKGRIEKGMDADLTVIDMDLSAKVEEKNLFSKCGWSPFEGWELKGWPIKTYIAGQLMYEWADKFGTNPGKEVEYN